MYYLENFLIIFSLRFGCRLIAYAETIAYGFSVYYLWVSYGFFELLETIFIIALATSCALSLSMLVSTLQEHESTGIIFSYLVWGIFMTIFVAIYLSVSFHKGDIVHAEAFAALFISSIVLKCYALLVVLSFMHMLVTSDSEDST